MCRHDHIHFLSVHSNFLTVNGKALFSQILSEDFGFCHRLEHKLYIRITKPDTSVDNVGYSFAAHSGNYNITYSIEGDIFKSVREYKLHFFLYSRLFNGFCRRIKWSLFYIGGNNSAAFICFNKLCRKIGMVSSHIANNTRTVYHFCAKLQSVIQHTINTPQKI